MVYVNNREWLAIQNNAISHLRNLTIFISMIFVFEKQLFEKSDNNFIIIFLCIVWMVLALFVLDEYIKRKQMIIEGIPLYQEKRDYFSYIMMMYILAIFLGVLRKMEIINF